MQLKDFAAEICKPKVSFKIEDVENSNATPKSALISLISVISGKVL